MSMLPYLENEPSRDMLAQQRVYARMIDQIAERRLRRSLPWFRKDLPNTCCSNEESSVSGTTSPLSLNSMISGRTTHRTGRGSSPSNT